jgi:hypothetical protein
MEFLYPGFLYALAALAVPVIIHLFNFRRFKKIPFTNVRFLKDIKQQTQAQNKLRHLLVLLMRLLALAFLVFAFAQPFIPLSDEAERNSRRNVSIFVDNSFSMEGESAAGAMIEVAKNRAIDIAMAYDATDRFQLLTNDFEGKHQRLVSRDVFVEWVQEIELSPQSQSLEDIYTRQRDLLITSQSEGDGKAFLISDFQKSRFDAEALPEDTILSVALVHLERNDISNLFVDSVWFDSPVRKLNDSERIKVRVVNAGTNSVDNVPVRLEVNGIQRAIASVNIDAGSQNIARLEYLHETPGLQKAKISIQDSPVSYDDSWYFGYDVFDEISILNVRESMEERDPMAGVFAGDSVYRYTTTTARNIDYTSLPGYRLVILSALEEIPSGLAAELGAFAENGGSVWLIPARNAELQSYNEFLATFGVPPFAVARGAQEKVTTLNAEHPLYRGVFESIPKKLDLPQVQRYYPTKPGTASGGDVLMLLSDGSPFLASYRPGRGQVYVLNASLHPEESNFARHALFVATALRIAELSQSTGLRAISIADDAFFSIPASINFGESNLHLVNGQENIDVIPLFQLRDGQYLISPGPEISKAGLYTLQYANEDISSVGLNYSRDESALESYGRSELDAILATRSAGGIQLYDGTDADLGRQVAKASTGTTLWKICLLLALAFLLFESLLLRFWKTRSA